MNRRYFKELDLSRLHDSLILLDLTGTITAPISSEIDPESSEVICRLATQGNEIYICSNGDTTEAQKKNENLKMPIQWLSLDTPKPYVGRVLQELQVKNKPIVVIGDSLHDDGRLALRLGVPCVLVRTLGSDNESEAPQPAKIRLPASLLPSDLGKICIFTQQPVFGISRITSFFNSIRRGTGSPVSELSTELAKLGIEVRVNPPAELITDTVLVISGEENLALAIEQKNRGFVRLILAGPEILSAPAQPGALLRSPEIDLILVSMSWIKKWLMSVDQYFEKAIIWSNGVTDFGSRESSAAETGHCIVYAKDAPEKLFHEITAKLWDQKMPIVVSKNALFSERQYRRLLQRARCLIFIASHDLTGQELKQAWMADVPTFSWQPGQYGAEPAMTEESEISTEDPTKECGAVFKNAEDFSGALQKFLENLPNYHPRQQALANYTVQRAAGELVAFIRQSLSSR